MARHYANCMPLVARHARRAQPLRWTVDVGKLVQENWRRTIARAKAIKLWLANWARDIGTREAAGLADIERR